MVKYDILFIDLDGTLLNSDHLTVSKRTRQTLIAAKNAGVILCVATGRTLCILPDIIWEIGFDYALVSNGASIYDLTSRKKVYANPFPLKAAKTAYELVKSEADFIEFFADGEIVLSREHYQKHKSKDLPIWHRHYFDKGKSPVVKTIEEYLDTGVPGLEKINLVRYPSHIIQSMHSKLSATGMFKMTGSIRSSIEVNAAGCTKGVALEAFCKQKNISIKRSVALGDADNDEEMIRTAGCGVAMENATTNIKLLADYITASNSEDGVAQFIEKYVL